MDKTSILFSISLTEQFEKLWGQFGAKTKKSPSQISERAIKVIRLGFEPKTHSLEGCCSIQLSYRTGPLSSGLRTRPLERLSVMLIPKVAANIVFFFEFSKFSFRPRDILHCLA